MARKKKDKQIVGMLAIALVVLSFLGAMQMGYLTNMGLPPLATAAVPQVTTNGQTVGATTGGIQVNVGTPTVEWYLSNAITGAEVTYSAWKPMRVTIAGTTTDIQTDDSADATLNDSYSICLKPNSTFYSTCVSGTVAGVVEKVRIPVYAIGTISLWANNDPENSTTRNGVDAPDTLAAGDTDTPTICFQGATANASFGNGKFLAVIDYNGNQLAVSPTFSKGVLNSGLIPSNYTADTNVGTNRVAYEIDGYLTNNETVCGSLTLVNGATKTAGFNWSGIRVSAYDYFQFRDGSTDKLATGYGATNSTSADTNSATNGTLHYSII